MTAPRALQIGWYPRGTRALRRLGWSVDLIVDATQWDGEHGWRGLVDRVCFVEDYRSSEDLAFALGRQDAAARRYAAVVAFDEFALAPAWQAATMLGLPFPAIELVSRMRDKALQKAAIVAAGLPCTDFSVVPDVRTAPELTARLAPRLPLAVKPLSGSGTENTYLARDATELERALDAFRTAGPRTVLVENEVTGREYHADGIVLDGRLRAFQLGRYLANVYAIKSGIPPASLAVNRPTAPDRYDEARELVRASLAALGHDRGVFHVELFETPSGWVFSEAAMRAGGAGIPLYYQTVHGLDLHELAIRAQLADRTVAGVGELAGADHTGWTALAAPPGRLLAVPDEQELRSRPGVLSAELTLRPGDTVPPVEESSATRIGAAVLRAASESEFVRLHRDLAGWFASRTTTRAG